MAEFKVGEIAVLQKCWHEHLNGCEVEIIAPLSPRPAKTRSGVIEIDFFYYVRLLVDGSVWAPAAHQLRRRPPKSDDTEWANEKVRDLLKVKPEEVTL